jgi:signal peptidase I
VASLWRFAVGAGQLLLWGMLLGFLALLVLPRMTPIDVLIVRGGSMEPSIHLGSVVIVDRAARTPAIGTAAAFRDGTGAIVTHRVIAIDAAGYETKGDANVHADLGRRAKDEVYGSVLLTVPYAGYVLHLLHQPIVFLILLLATGGVLVVGELRSIRSELLRSGNRREVRDEG